MGTKLKRKKQSPKQKRKKRKHGSIDNTTNTTGKKVTFSDEKTVLHFKFKWPAKFKLLSTTFRKNKASKSLLEKATKRSSILYKKLTKSRNTIIDNIMALEITKGRNSVLELEKNGVQIYSKDQLLKECAMTAEEVDQLTLLNKKELEEVKKLSKEEMLKKVPSYGMSQLDEKSHKQLKKFINKKFNMNMKQNRNSKRQMIEAELSLRGVTLSAKKGHRAFPAIKRRLEKLLEKEKNAATSEKNRVEELRRKLSSETEKELLDRLHRSLIDHLSQVVRELLPSSSPLAKGKLKLETLKDTAMAHCFRYELLMAASQKAKRRFIDQLNTEAAGDLASFLNMVEIESEMTAPEMAILLPVKSSEFNSFPADTVSRIMRELFHFELVELLSDEDIHLLINTAIATKTRKMVELELAKELQRLGEKALRGDFVRNFRRIEGIFRRGLKK